MALAARAGCSQAVYAACSRAGLAAVMPAKWRLEVVASRYISNSAARRLVGIASQINRGFKGRKLRLMAGPVR